MSQVKFKVDKHFTAPPHDTVLEVMAGWDNPLQEYFLTIFDTNADDHVVMSSLEFDHDLVGLKSTDPLKKLLAECKIDAPDGFWERVQRQEGNITYVFKDGKWRSW